MVHHDSRDYNVAVSEAARHGRAKMEGIIQAGIASAEKVINDVQARIITDRVVKTAGAMVPGTKRKAMEV